MSYRLWELGIPHFLLFVYSFNCYCCVACVSWDCIRILDSIISDGWLLVTSCICHRPTEAAVDVEDSQYHVARCLVTVVHMKSGKFGVFSACMGTLLPHGQCALMTVTGTGTTGNHVSVLDLDKVTWHTDRNSNDLVAWDLANEAVTASVKWTVESSGAPTDKVPSVATSALPFGYLVAYGEYLFRFPLSTTGLVSSFQVATGSVLLDVPLTEIHSGGASSSDAGTDSLLVAACLDSHQPQHPVVKLLCADGSLLRVELSKLVKRGGSKK
jgi:hypothetical protein